jgi:hypothetical protein
LEYISLEVLNWKYFFFVWSETGTACSITVGDAGRSTAAGAFFLLPAFFPLLSPAAPNEAVLVSYC